MLYFICIRCAEMNTENFNMWMMFWEAILFSLTASSHTVLHMLGWSGWPFLFFGFSHGILIFFLFKNPKWQIIFFQVFPKDVNWTLHEIFKSGSYLKKKSPLAITLPTEKQRVVINTCDCRAFRCIKGNNKTYYELWWCFQGDCLHLIFSL